MAYSYGVKLEDIRHGLRTFDTTFFQAPGRLNIYDEHPFKVLLDYAHNAAAMDVMCKLVSQIPVEGRKICVIAAPGDRRDEDVVEIAAKAAGTFDHYICRRDDSLRDRGPEEIPNIIRKGLIDAGVPEENIDIVPEEAQAVDTALRMGEPGDLVVLFADALTRTWKQIVNFPSGGKGPAPAPEASPVELDVDDFEIETGQTLVRDEKGVRLAREIED